MQPAANGIAGHEGAGIVVKTHESVKHLWRLGDRAGIKFIASVCNECEACETDHDELRCARNLSSGVNTPGTFQEYVATDARYASKIPEGVKDEEAGPIMCGGVTAYTALKKSEVRPGQVSFMQQSTSPYWTLYVLYRTAWHQILSCSRKAQSIVYITAYFLGI
jgi:propanol-preferring alcohol dehydrogenase